MPLKVFYIDDEPELCEIFADEFSSANTLISTFVNPEKAIEAVKSNPPDIIFIDYRLPGTNGDLVSQAMPPKIPKFLVTGESSVTTKYKFEVILEKPFNRDAISKIIARFFEQKKVS